MVTQVEPRVVDVGLKSGLDELWQRDDGKGLREGRSEQDVDVGGCRQGEGLHRHRFRAVIVLEAASPVASAAAERRASAPGAGLSPRDAGPAVSG
jgi:hypothetical protein